MPIFSAARAPFDSRVPVQKSWYSRCQPLVRDVRRGLFAEKKAPLLSSMARALMVARIASDTPRTFVTSKRV